MASRLGKLAKMGGAVAGFFRGRADNTAPNPPKQPETDLAEGARKLPKTGSPKSNQKVSSVQPLFGLASDQELKTVKTCLGAYADQLKDYQEKLSSIADDLASKKKSKTSRHELDQLADDMVGDVDTFCEQKLKFNLTDVLSQVDFKDANWEQYLLAGLKARLKPNFPETSQHMASWLLNQILATGAVCLGALEEGDDRVFGEYLKLAHGSVQEQWEQVQDGAQIDKLINGWTDSSTHRGTSMMKAFFDRLSAMHADESISGSAPDANSRKSPSIKKSEISSESSDSSSEEVSEKSVASSAHPTPTEKEPVEPEVPYVPDGSKSKSSRSSSSSNEEGEEPKKAALQKRMSAVQQIATDQQKEDVTASSSEDGSESQ